MCGEIEDADGNGRLQWQTGTDDAHLDVLTAPADHRMSYFFVSVTLYVWL